MYIILAFQWPVLNQKPNQQKPNQQLPSITLVLNADNFWTKANINEW